MTRDQLANRALSCLPADRARFGPLVLFILGAIFAEVIAYYTEKMLDKCNHKSIRNPWPWDQWRLRRHISRAWRSPGFAARILEARDTHPEFSTELARVNPDALDREHTGDVATALLAMVRGMTDAEIATTLGRPA